MKAALDRCLDAFGAAPVDPHTQALFQGKTGKAPTDKTAGSGYQNLHCNPRLAWLMRHSSSARCGIAGHISDRTHPAIGNSAAHSG